MMNVFRLFALAFLLMEYSNVPAQGIWTQKANYGGGGTSEETAFSIGTKGYVGGNNSGFWEYDQVTDTWTQMATFIGSSRNSATAFSIGTKGYLGTGGSYNDFYEWDQATNTWTAKANFGGSGREGAIGFEAGGKGYIGMGGNYLNDLWEYDPALDAWTQVASLPGPGRYHAAAFSVSGKGYIATGFNGSFLADLWEFDPVLNSWTQMSSFPGTSRDRAEGWAIGLKGYVVAGWSGNSALNDFWEWDQPTNTWTALTSLPGAARYNAIGMAIGSKGYIGTGVGAGSDFWEYGSNCSMQVTQQNSTCYSSCDGSATVILPDPGAVVSYSWNTSPLQTTQTATSLCPGTWIVTMTDTSGCSNSLGITISSPPAITGTAVETEPDCFGGSDGSLCVTASGGSGSYTAYAWSNGQTASCATALSSGSYTVTVTDTAGCTGTLSFTLGQPAQLVASLSHTNATCSTCANGNATANIMGGTGPYIFSWSNGVTNSAYITGLLPGTYTCCITDAHGCSVCDSTTVGSPSGTGNLNVQENLLVVPNPAAENLHITLDAFRRQEVSYMLTDISGRICLSGHSRPQGTLDIQIASLEEGLYLLHIDAGNRTFTARVVRKSNRE